MRRRSTGIAAIILLTVFAIGCGNTFRPIATPVVEPGGDPNNLRHAVVVVQNGGSRGGASNIDTTGDTNTGNVVAGIMPVRAGFVSNSRTYIANAGDNTVTRYLTLSPASPPATITMPAGCTPNFVMSQNNGTAYVACSGLNSLAVMNVGLDSIITTVPLGFSPTHLDELPNGTKVYAMSNSSTTVDVLATIDNTVVATITLDGGALSSAQSQNSGLLFVSTTANTVNVIDTTTNALATTAVTPVNSIAVGTNPKAIVFERTKQRLYVANAGDGTVSVIDAVATSPTFMTVIATIPVGTDPESLTALNNGTKVYTANCSSNSVSVIDTTALAVINTILTGTCPISITSPTDSSRAVVGVRGAPGGTNFADPPSILDISAQSDTILVNLKPPQQSTSCNAATAANNYCPLQIPVYVTMAP